MQIVGLILLLLIAGSLVTNPLVYLFVAIFGVVEVLLNFYFFAIIILIIISWVAPGTYNPAAMLLQQVTEPVIAPFRRLLPSMGGLDFSPMLALFIIHILNSIVMPGLMRSLSGII